MKTEITIAIDTDQLEQWTDEYLAQLWHIAQANPAPLDDPDAGEIAESIGREIVKRWLRNAGPALWHHQGRHHYWSHLIRFAHWDKEARTWVPGAPSDLPSNKGNTHDC